MAGIWHCAIDILSVEERIFSNQNELIGSESRQAVTKAFLMPGTSKNALNFEGQYYEA